MAAIIGWYSCGKSLKILALNSWLDIGNPTKARVSTINFASSKNRVIILSAKFNSFNDIWKKLLSKKKKSNLATSNPFETRFETLD